MFILDWIDRHAVLYRIFSALLVLLLVLMVGWQVNSGIEQEREAPLAEALYTYISAVEGGTVNVRGLGAAILLGLESREVKQRIQKKWQSAAAPSSLNVLRALSSAEAAYLVNRHGLVTAYSSSDNTPGIKYDLSSRPYVEMAVRGNANVYPAIDEITNQRGIFLSAPVHSAQNSASKIIGAIVLKCSARSLDFMLKSWTAGPALLLSPQGLVFASNRDDWLFHVNGDPGREGMDKIRRARQFGNLFDHTLPPSLPSVLDAPEVTIDGVSYIVRTRELNWDDPAGGWLLMLLDRRVPWWSQRSALGQAVLSGVMVALALFWLSTFARNATLRQINHRELSIAAATFESREGIMITDADRVIIKVNHAFTEITGYASEEAVGKTPGMLSSGRQDKEFYRRMWGVLDREKSWRGEIWNKRKNGEIYPEQLIITPIFDEHGKLVNYVGIFSDVTRRKSIEQEIHNLAFCDQLTGLPNRRLLSERMAHAMAASKRSGRYGALMFLDLDNFKQLNDRHGHAMGDLLLVEVAGRIAACVRESDTVARFGGDEFVVMLSELDVDRARSTRQAGIVAEKIRTILAEPYLLSPDEQNHPTIPLRHLSSSSIGVALFVGLQLSQEEVLRRADIAMYQAKSSGRNQLRFFETETSRLDS